LDELFDEVNVNSYTYWKHNIHPKYYSMTDEDFSRERELHIKIGIVKP